MFADPRKEREREREREGGGKERDREVRATLPRYFRARANFTHTQIFHRFVFFLFPRFASLFLYFPKRRIFIQKLFFGDKIVVMIDD